MTPSSNKPMTIFPEKAVAITKSDSTEYKQGVTVYVGGTGDVAIVPLGGTVAVTFKGVPAGGIVPCRALKVMSTNTTATDIVGVW